MRLVDYKLQLIILLVGYNLQLLPAMATTIAWDGQRLACDSQMTQGHKKLMCKGKFYRSDSRHATLAGGGDVDLLDKISHYWKSSDKPLSELKLPDSNPMSQSSRFQLLIVQDDGMAFFYDDDLINPVQIEAPYAFGSGGDFALAAMAMGASAADAIAVAEQLDIYSGGTIHVTRAPQKALEVAPMPQPANMNPLVNKLEANHSGPHKPATP
jgi:ATP-dependent protease HslVU (ClpYQ) peptidase subunit